MLNMLIIGLMARPHAELSRFRRFAGHYISVTALIVIRLRERAAGVGPARAEPSDRRVSRARRGRSLAGMILTFALMSFSQIFFHSRDLGEACSILKQVLGISPSGPTGWSDMPLDLSIPAWICMAIALFVGAGAPASENWPSRINEAAPNWLQYGVCLFLLSVLSTAGSGRFVYGQF